MAWSEKYKTLTRDRHNILWTTSIYQPGSVGGITYGLQYNWYAVADARNIANTGWHVMTYSDFTTLQTYIGGYTQGGKLKEVGLEHWLAPNTGATNEMKFYGRGSGNRLAADGTFSGLKGDLNLHINGSWTPEVPHIVIVLAFNTGNIGSSVPDDFGGASVRLVKDNTVLGHGEEGTYTGNDGKQYTSIGIGNMEILSANLAETKYRNGDNIPEVTGNAAWIALTTGALCSFDNDWENAYGGAAETLIGAGAQPLRFEFCNESDNIYDPIKSTRAITSAWSFAMFALAELYQVEEMHHKVEIFQGEALYWTGYVDPKQYQEPYGPVPYPVDICCVDGLTLLKNTLYDNGGTDYTGNRLESQIVLDILGKIGFTAFKEYVNIYEQGMNDGVGDSPLDQTSIQVEVFKGMYCDEVLKEILKKYGANIQQKDGIFCLYRPKELIEATIYGRHFTAPTTKTAVQITPKQYFKRPDYSSPFLETKTGGLMIQPPASKVKIIHDLGNRESWIKNSDFKAETFDPDTKELDDWTVLNPTFLDIHHLTEMVASEDEGIGIGSTNAFQVTGIKQTIGYGIESTTDKFVLDFEFGWYNNTTPNNAVTNVFLEIKCGVYYLEELDDNNAGWTTTPSYISIFLLDVLGSTTVPSGFTGWFTYKRQITGIPQTGYIKITAGGQLIANIYNCYHFISFYVTSFQASAGKSTMLKPVGPRHRESPSTMVARTYDMEIIKVTKHEYEKSNNIRGEVLQYDFLLGDVAELGIQNLIGQFAGALARSAPQTCQDTITLTGTSGSANITCNGITRLIEFVTNLTTTATNFKFLYGVNYLPISLVSNQDTLIFTHNVAGSEFSGPTTIVNVSGDLGGTVETTKEPFYLVPTTVWNTRGGTQNKPLLHLICDEIALQFSRPKHFLDLPILEIDQAASALNMLGNFQDAINTLNGYFRAFIASRGTFNVKQRQWKLDLVEIGEGDPISGATGQLTADTTLETGDSTELTADQTEY